MRYLLAFLLSAFAALATVGALVASPNSGGAVAIRGEPVSGVGEALQDLWKRRGGGGGGGRGGGGSSSSGSSSGGSSSSGSGSSSGGSSGGSTGGSSSGSGSGPRPAYGGGAYYGGGAAVPYKAGSPSRSGISPFFLGAGVGLAFWPGLWLYGAYMYPYHHHYSYHNRTSDKNESRPVICACDPYNPCGCDENTNSSYILDLIGDGSYNGLNKSVITIAEVNGTETILINGTLPDGTTAAGGSESPNAGSGLHTVLVNAGWWPVVATVVAMVFF